MLEEKERDFQEFDSIPDAIKHCRHRAAELKPGSLFVVEELAEDVAYVDWLPMLAIEFVEEAQHHLCQEWPETCTPERLSQDRWVGILQDGTASLIQIHKPWWQCTIAELKEQGRLPENKGEDAK